LVGALGADRWDHGGAHRGSTFGAASLGYLARSGIAPLPLVMSRAVWGSCSPALVGSCREAAQGRESLAEIQTLLATFLQRREEGRPRRGRPTRSHEGGWWSVA